MTDTGVPNTLVPQGNRFAPRVGLAYSPGNQGILGKILGGPGKTSIRAGYGIFNSVIEGNTIALTNRSRPTDSAIPVRLRRSLLSHILPRRMGPRMSIRSR